MTRCPPVIFYCFGLLILLSSTVSGAATEKQEIEGWADSALPVKDALRVWLDATRQVKAWEAHEKTLIGGEPMDVWYDGSGHRRHFTQPLQNGQPSFLEAKTQAAVRFDGKDDHLRWSGADAPLQGFTIFIVAAAHSNEGGFRAFLSAHETGKNDFSTGFNLDMGPRKSDGPNGFRMFNVEGSGFVGAKNLLPKPIRFDTFQVFSVSSAPGSGGVIAGVNGKPAGSRDRAPGSTSAAENLIVGARCAGGGDVPPHLIGFLHGDIAEVLLYERVLTTDERAAVERYLIQKHEGAADALEQIAAGGKPLQTIENPPAVQMFVPGFTARQLPLDLTNINNLRYRDDGKLVALAYDGNIYLLSDTDGDGLEDKSELFWDNAGENGGRIKAPVGMALTPPGYAHGRGMFVPSMGKLSLIVDTNGDDKADKEIVVAEGWPPSFVNVDATGVVMGPDGSVYFGIGTANFVEPLLIDKEGRSQYDLSGERGTIIRVAPDLKSREILCTGIRFPIGLAFNRAGDLFATDQEGATWVPSGNPFDELLHIQRGRHYGFPPRHPKHLPNVIDEPSTFDYVPQHQSTCGILFNEPVHGGPTFGPPQWRGDAIVCGSSRGKIYRTELTETAAGYVARNHVIGSVPMLLIDACLSPTGDLVMAMHSGNPDWGSGPTGKGRLVKVSYRNSEAPQPVLTWPSGPNEVRVAFNRPLDPASLAGIAKQISIDAGPYVGAGDRFETIRPGYAIVKRQRNTPRQDVPVQGVQITRDGRTLVLTTARQSRAVSYGLTLPGVGREPASAGEIEQINAIDLAYDLSGVALQWQGEGESARTIDGWLPHPDLSVSRAFTRNSADHDAIWEAMDSPGRLTLRTKIDVRDMLRPAVQPGSKLDYTLPPERVTLAFNANVPLQLRVDGKPQSGTRFTLPEGHAELVAVEIMLATGKERPELSVTFTTAEDDRKRPLPLRRFLLPWAQQSDDAADAVAIAPPPELKGGDWLRGRQVFFGKEAACFRCHQVRGQGSDLGPDLSNLIHRDYESVMRDIRDPGGALNPDYVASRVEMKNGNVFHGIMRKVGDDRFVVRGDYLAEHPPRPSADVKQITPLPTSVMPTGIVEGIGPDKTRDLLTFLLTEPLTPAPIERKGAPPARTRAEIEAVLGGGVASDAASAPAQLKPLNILLVWGPKDHGPSEHDYPAWQERWTTLLGLADGVTVDSAEKWPTPAQWDAADVAVFYSANPAWGADKTKDVDRFLARGGGIVVLHAAVHGRDHVEAWADRIGLAWRDGFSKFRHGALELSIRDTAHPIMRGFERIRFVDESYWNLIGDPSRIKVLADTPEEGKPRPMVWIREHEKGRVVANLLGHYTWTFDDPLFRIMLLRSICWSAREPADRLSGLATIGARMQP
jgi:putative heme-binding domain-containing protein